METATQLTCLGRDPVELRTWTSPGMPTSPPTAHASLEVAWVDRGGASFRVGSRVMPLRPGAVMIVPMDVEHATGFDGPSHGHALGLDSAFVDDIAGRIGCSTSVLAAAIEPSSELLVLCRILARECTHRSRGHVVTARALAEAIVVEVLRRWADDGATAHSDRRIEAARERIHAEFARPLTVGDLAATAGLSRYHFSRLFRRQIGRSPQEYLIHVRLTEAARRLADPQARVTAISLDVGFSDPSRFCRRFKAAYGVTPSDYANAVPARATPRRGQCI